MRRARDLITLERTPPDGVWADLHEIPGAEWTELVVESSESATSAICAILEEESIPHTVDRGAHRLSVEDTRERVKRAARCLRPVWRKRITRYQKEHLVRHVRHRGGWAHWDCGTGKTMLGVLYALAHLDARVLVVTKSVTVLQWLGQVRDVCRAKYHQRFFPIRGRSDYAVKPGLRGRHRATARLNMEHSREAILARVQSRICTDKTGRADSMGLRWPSTGRKLTVGQRDLLKRLLRGETLPLTKPVLRLLDLFSGLDAETGIAAVIRTEELVGRCHARLVSTATGEVEQSYLGDSAETTPALMNLPRALLQRYREDERAGAVPQADRLRALVALAGAQGLGVADTLARVQQQGFRSETLESVAVVRAHVWAHADQWRNAQALHVPEGGSVGIIGWAVLTERRQMLMDWDPQVVIFDESHQAKAHKRWTVIPQPQGKPKFEPKFNTTASAMLIADNPQAVLLLSAEAAPDRPRDLWAQMDLLDKFGWGNFSSYAVRYCAGIDGTWGFISDGSSNPKELSARLDVYRSRVRREDAMKELPGCTRRVVWLEQHDLVAVPLDKKLWDNASKIGPMALLELQLCMSAASKHRWLVTQALEYVRAGEQVVILTGRRNDAANLYAELANHRSLPTGTPTWVAHGGTPKREREVIREFIRDSDDPLILVGTVNAWGEAIDGLQSVHRALIPMLPWNHGMLVQLEGRFERLGSRRPTSIEYPIASNSVDPAVLDVVIDKARSVGVSTGNADLGKLSDALEGVDCLNEVLDGMAERLLAAAEKYKTQLT